MAGHGEQLVGERTSRECRISREGDASRSPEQNSRTNARAVSVLLVAPSRFSGWRYAILNLINTRSNKRGSILHTKKGGGITPASAALRSLLLVEIFPSSITIAGNIKILDACWAL